MAPWLLVALDLAIPSQLAGRLPHDLAGAVAGLALRLRAPEAAEPGEVAIELVHTNVGRATLRVIEDDCDSLTHFVQIDGVEYPLRRRGPCRLTERLLDPGESFSTFAAIRAIAAPFHHLEEGPAAGCGTHRIAASYRANSFNRRDPLWEGSLDTLPLALEVSCPP